MALVIEMLFGSKDVQSDAKDALILIYGLLIKKMR
jgi:hypothetical protein